MLDDVATGAYSLLEHHYLTRVERPHGLPTGRRQRQVRVGRTTAYRAVEYLGLGAVVELDGRLGHELAAERASPGGPGCAVSRDRLWVPGTGGSSGPSA